MRVTRKLYMIIAVIAWALIWAPRTLGRFLRFLWKEEE